MKYRLLLYIFLFTNISAFGQEPIIADSIPTREGYKRWTNYKTSIRVGIGMQDVFCGELGIAKHKFYYNDLGYASSAYYSSVEWIPTLFSNNSVNIYSLKAGYEINARTLALGLEAKYQSDFDRTDFVITPKIGFGVMGFVNIFYGYNISFSGHPFYEISNNQFSIVVNLSTKLHK